MKLSSAMINCFMTVQGKIQDFLKWVPREHLMAIGIPVEIFGVRSHMTFPPESAPCQTHLKMDTKKLVN